jgi:choline kinase
LRAVGIEDVGVVVGWQSDKVIERLAPLDVTIIENLHPDIRASGTSHSFQFAARSPWNPLDGKSPLLLLDGDLAYEQAVLRLIADDRSPRSRLFISPTINEDSEEVLVYARNGHPTLIGKGLGAPITDGLQLLGEATGIVRFEPEDHSLVASLLTWLVGVPGQSSGFGFARIASEHEELAQYLCTLQRLEAVPLPPDLLFMEVDFQEEFDHLGSRVYPEILRKDSGR